MSTASELLMDAHVYQDHDYDQYSGARDIDIDRADSTSTSTIPYTSSSDVDPAVDSDPAVDADPSVDPDPPVIPEWVAIIDQSDDSTAVWASEFELMRMRDLDDHDIDNNTSSTTNTNIITRPPTPPWSSLQPWVANLETINVQCINNLNMTFQSSSNTFGLDNVNLEFGHEHELEDDLDYVCVAIDQQENDQITLDLLEQAFERVRERANAIIDEAKSKAMTVIKEQVPPHLQTDAVDWYAKNLNVVMAFLGHVGKAMKNVMPLLTNRAQDAWISILRALRIGVAKRAIVAVQGVRNLESVRAITAGEQGVPAVWLR